MAGISSSELDSLAGLSVGYAGQIESGKKANLTVDTLGAVAAVFGRKAAYLLGEGRRPSKRAVERAVAQARRKQKGKK